MGGWGDTHTGVVYVNFGGELLASGPIMLVLLVLGVLGIDALMHIPNSAPLPLQCRSQR